MKVVQTVLLCMAVLIGLPAFAAVEVTPTLVRSGYFLAEDCKPQVDPKLYNECICQANIRKAQVSGLPEDVMSRINEHLSLFPEKLASESCEGVATTVPVDGLKVNTANADYTVTYQTPSVLTVLITYSTYGVGAEHSLDGADGYTFDLASGKLIDPLNYLKPDQIAKVDGYIKTELQHKYSSVLYDEVKTRTEPFLSENGCDTCTLFYGKEGWTVRFQITAVAPSSSGEPEVAVPSDIIPPPEKLIVKS